MCCGWRLMFLYLCVCVEIDVFLRVCEGRLKCLYVCVSGD